MIQYYLLSVYNEGTVTMATMLLCSSHRIFSGRNCKNYMEKENTVFGKTEFIRLMLFVSKIKY